MKTLKADWTTTYTSTTHGPDTYDITQVNSFIKYLIEEFAKYDLNGEFNLPKGYEGGVVIFTDPKQQFLYELRGGFALYKRLREAYLQWQEQLLIDAMNGLRSVLPPPAAAGGESGTD